jgi:hypothetical protein
MKKSLGVLAGAALLVLSGQAFAASEMEVGEAIFKKGLGTGCYGCHAAASNPQIKELIKAGTLTRDKFGEVLKKGQKGMPEGISSIMKIKQVKEAGYTEEQAIDAIYKYLGK